MLAVGPRPAGRRWWRRLSTTRPPAWRAQVVVVGDAAEWQGDVLQARARPALLDQRIAVGRGAGRSGDAEQRVEVAVGPHRDQPAAAVHVGRERGGLRGADRNLGQDHQPHVGQRTGRDAIEIGGVEAVDALGPENLGQIVIERVRRHGVLGDHEDRLGAALALNPGPGHRGQRRREHRHHAYTPENGQHRLPSEMPDSRSRAGPLPSSATSRASFVPRTANGPGRTDRNQIAEKSAEIRVESPRLV